MGAMPEQECPEGTPESAKQPPSQEELLQALSRARDEFRQYMYAMHHFMEPKVLTKQKMIEEGKELPRSTKRDLTADVADDARFVRFMRLLDEMQNLLEQLQAMECPLKNLKGRDVKAEYLVWPLSQLTQLLDDVRQKTRVVLKRHGIPDEIIDDIGISRFELVQWACVENTLIKQALDVVRKINNVTLPDEEEEVED